MQRTSTGEAYLYTAVLPYYLQPKLAADPAGNTATIGVPNCKAILTSSDIDVKFWAVSSSWRPWGALMSETSACARKFCCVLQPAQRPCPDRRHERGPAIR